MPRRSRLASPAAVAHAVTPSFAQAAASRQPGAACPCATEKRAPLEEGPAKTPFFHASPAPPAARLCHAPQQRGACPCRPDRKPRIAAPALRLATSLRRRALVGTGKPHPAPYKGRACLACGLGPVCRAAWPWLCGPPALPKWRGGLWCIWPRGFNGLLHASGGKAPAPWGLGRAVACAGGRAWAGGFSGAGQGARFFLWQGQGNASVWLAGPAAGQAAPLRCARRRGAVSRRPVRCASRRAALAA